MIIKPREFIKVTAIFFILQGCSGYKADKEPQNDFLDFKLVQISEIEPQGWLRQFLEFQREGLTGHIEAAGYPFNTGMWTERITLDHHTLNERDRSFKADGAVEKEDEGVFWWPYEQTGYYIDAAIKCGYLLGDSLLLNRARHQIEHIMKNPRENGKLGPVKMIGRWFNWPYAGLFRSFITEYDETGNEQIVEALHSHYLHFTAEDFQDELDVCNVEELCWLYQRTGDSSLLEMAEESYALFKSIRENRNRDNRDIVFTSDREPDYHGVVYFEIVKLPAILYAATGKEEYLSEALHGISKMELYNMLASGIPSTTEHFNGISETAGHESCNLATLPYTYGTMLRATGNVEWADKIEKAVFNAGLGSITKDFKAHQYFSAPNQMIATLNSNHFGYYPACMAYRPGHNVACCTGNINRVMPYYVMQMWLRTKENGIAAALYGPSEISTLLGKDNTPVTIKQTTKYPFDESIEFEINTSASVAFDFQVRIPAWCNNPELTINGKKSKAELRPGTFHTIRKKFSDGDLVRLDLPMEIKAKQWPNNGVSVERGPVVYSFPVPDSIVIAYLDEKSSPGFPALEFYPAGTWQYSPVLSDLQNIEVLKNDNYQYPWDPDTPPVKLRLPARIVENWELNTLRGEKEGEVINQISGFPGEPVLSGEANTIELIPYGSTKLRVTVFPGVSATGEN